MKTLFVVLLSVFFLFISCNEDEGNPSGGTNPLVGSWFLTKDRFSMMVNNVIIEKDSSVYATATESFLVLSFSKSLVYSYEKDEEDSVTYVDTIPYTASGGKIALEEDTADYSISGSTLCVSTRYDDADTTYFSDMFLNRYTGNIPPDGWPPISFELKEGKLLLKRNNKIQK